MSANRLPFGLAVSVLAVLASASPRANADPTKDECLDANGKGQDLRRAGQFSAATDELRKCAASSCPAIVRSDCTRRLDELQKAQPTIAFEAKDSSGGDLSAVAVTMDGEPLSDRLDGTALLVDPGEHVFAFTAAAQTPVTRKLVVTEGEKGRRESIVFGPPVSALSTQEPTPPASGPGNAPSPPSAEGPGAQKGVAIGIGAGGIAGLAVGSIFGALAASKWNTAKSECPTHTGCSTQALHDHDGAAILATVSTVGLIAGGALVALGITLFFTAPAAESAGVALHIAPGGFFAEGSF